ncbi:MULTISPECIES: DUF2993 domain-containing protein [Microbacterium]|uniref:LmeA family phospholipid-binding protein n=1 Tax=Microbacterium TaxID=33882 RepID=UPI001F0D7A2D|nr:MULTISPECIES: DUF2993 domain-containing protein [Microbacterium]
MSDPAPFLPFPVEEQGPRRRSRRWPWIVTLGVVLALVAAAAVGAEALARGAVQAGVRQVIVMQLDLPADQEVDVEVDGLVLPQLLSGRLDRIAVASDDVALGPVAGDVRVALTDVPLSADAAAGPGTATVRLDEDQLRALLATIDGFPADTLGIAAPDLTIGTELSVLGASFPIGVALQPGAAEGDLTLTPTRFTLGETEVDADALRARFGGLADAVLRTWDVCIAEHLPAALTLTSVQVDRDTLVAGFDIDGAVVIDPDLRASGSCS